MIFSVVLAEGVSTCNRIMVVVNSGESYYFVFEKWFAVEKEDGKVEREVMAADRALGFYKVLRLCYLCYRRITVLKY